MRLPHHVVALKRPLLHVLDRLLYFGPAFAHHRRSSLFSIVFELSRQLDEVVGDDSPVQGGRERHDHLAFECRIHYGHFYSAPSR